MGDKRYLTVTALTKYIKYKFDQDAHLKNVLLKGEISNFKHHSRGHFYFTLKDDHAQISAIMFAGNARKIKFRPEDGMNVLVEGYISVYEPGGSYQIYVQSMTEDGVGNLYIAFEQLKEKLQNEGLFDSKHKQPIPRFPRRIGVLTSPTGAAVRDIIHIVNRRYPLAEIIVYPTLVQGEYAKDSIVQQVQKANQDGLVDVIILGRGGGSIEDLWPFNEEIVAYAIFASKIPVISSVGHETDFTISDFVADLRAPTPSGAAEVAVPDKIELLGQLQNLRERLRSSLNIMLKQHKERYNRVFSSYVFGDPQRILENGIRKLDLLDEKLKLLSPKKRIQQLQKDVLDWDRRLYEIERRILSDKKKSFDQYRAKLELLNPLALMKKGYGVMERDGVVITSVSSIQKGDYVSFRLRDGHIESKVVDVRKENENE
jgi:exodeoxyribonuclease VII large subunit